MKRILRALVTVPVWLLLGVFFFYPIWQVIGGGFRNDDGQFTLAWIAEVLRNPIYVEGLANALWLAVTATAIVFVLALPAAMLNARCRYRGKGLVSALLLAPMVLPPFVGVLGFQQFWGRCGVVNTLLERVGLPTIDWLGTAHFGAVALVMALHLYPIVYLNAVAALSNIDPAMEEAARCLGAGRWRRLWRIRLPLMAPGLFAGGTITFIWAFTELGTPLMLGFTRVTSVQVFHGIREIGDNPFPYALVTILLVASTLLYVLGKCVFSRGAGQSATLRAARGSQEEPLRGLGNLLLLGWTIFTLALALLPHIGLVLLSVARDWYASVLPNAWTLDHYREALGNSLTISGINNSLRYAGWATLVDLLLGLGAAWVIVRHRGRLAWVLDVLVMLPLAVPGLILAFGYLAMTAPGRWLSFLNPTDNPTILLIIAYAIRRLPYIVRAVAAGLEQVSESLEEAGRCLGAGRLTVLRRITLPLIAANVIAGLVLVFAFAMLEVSDSLMLAQKAAWYPITKSIYALAGLLGTGPSLAAALGTWCMVFLALSLACAATLLGRRMGALFRV